MVSPRCASVARHANLVLGLQAGCTPFAGLLGDRFNRKYLISAGTLLWGCFSAGFGLSRNYTQARLPGR